MMELLLCPSQLASHWSLPLLMTFQVHPFYSSQCHPAPTPSIRMATLTPAVPLPLFLLKHRLSVTNSLHGVRFYRHFFGFIFITLVVAFDTVDRSLSLKILPSPRFCETHPPRLFLLPLWPFLSQVPSLVPLLLLHSQHQGFFVLFCFS